MGARAGGRGVDGRHILGIKGRGSALEMKVGPAFQQSDATIPSENAVVIAGRPNLFRVGKASHGFFNQRQENVRGAAAHAVGLAASSWHTTVAVKPTSGTPATPYTWMP